MLQKPLKMSDIVLSLSTALDLNTHFVLNHSYRVAYLSLLIARKLALSQEDIDLIVLSALLHDIGMIKTDAKIEASKQIEIENELINKHCRRGYDFLKDIDLFSNISEIILYHHDRWDGKNVSQLTGEDIPLPARIIHLADRIEVSINRDEYILFQVREIKEKIANYMGTLFDPYLVKIFTNLADKEAIWLDLEYGYYKEIIKKWSINTRLNITLKVFEEIAKLFADIIDRKSPFTGRHSKGVADTALMISSNMGFTEREQRIMYISGLLHDLGKMAIPDNILESKEKLTNKEIKIMKQHTYHTYYLLKQIEGLQIIPGWAAYHHEKLDGSGYPFHLKGKDLDTGSRIMAVSDIYQALTEKRPYRDPLPDKEAVKILTKIGNSGKIDLKVISVLEDVL